MALAWAASDATCLGGWAVRGEPSADSVCCTRTYHAMHSSCAQYSNQHAYPVPLVVTVAVAAIASSRR